MNQNKNTKPRKLLESFYLYCNSNSMNKTMHFSEIYPPTMQKIIKISWTNIEYFNVLTFSYNLSNSFLVLANLYGMWVYSLITYWFWTKQNTFGYKTIEQYCKYNRILCSLSGIVNHFLCLNIFSQVLICIYLPV